MTTTLAIALARASLTRSLSSRAVAGSALRSSFPPAPSPPPPAVPLRTATPAPPAPWPASALERTRVLASLPPASALAAAAAKRLDGGGAALLALLSTPPSFGGGAASPSPAAERFVRALDARALETLFSLLVDVAFVSGGAQAARLAPAVLPLALGRAAELCGAPGSSAAGTAAPGGGTATFDGALVSTAARALAAHACAAPAWLEWLDAELCLRLRGGSGAGVDADFAASESTGTAAFVASLPLERWAWLMEALAEGGPDAAEALAAALAAHAPAPAGGAGTVAVRGDLGAVERLVSGALRASAPAAVCAKLLEALLARQKAQAPPWPDSAPSAEGTLPLPPPPLQLRDSLKVEGELLRTLCLAAVGSQTLAPATAATLDALLRAITARLSLLGRPLGVSRARHMRTGQHVDGSDAAAGRVQAHVPTGSVDDAHPLPRALRELMGGRAPVPGGAGERALRRFFGRHQSGALLPNTNAALRSVSTLLGAARCLAVLCADADVEAAVEAQAQAGKSEPEGEREEGPLALVRRLPRLPAPPLDALHAMLVAARAEEEEARGGVGPWAGEEGALAAGPFEAEMAGFAEASLAEDAAAADALGAPRRGLVLRAGRSYLQAQFELDIAFPLGLACGSDSCDSSGGGSCGVAIEFDGPSHFCAPAAGAVCRALGRGAAGAGSALRPRVWPRRALRELPELARSLALAAGAARERERLRPSPGHVVRARQLALLGWRLVSVPFCGEAVRAPAAAARRAVARAAAIARAARAISWVGRRRSPAR